MRNERARRRITKREFYAMGGLANPRLFRKQPRNSGWKYYMLLD